MLCLNQCPVSPNIAVQIDMLTFHAFESTQEFQGIIPKSNKKVAEDIMFGLFRQIIETIAQ